MARRLPKTTFQGQWNNMPLSRTERRLATAVGMENLGQIQINLNNNIRGALLTNLVPGEEYKKHTEDLTDPAVYRAQEITDWAVHNAGMLLAMAEKAFE